MRDADTVLSIIRERGRQGKPLEEVYRQLFNPALYFLAYGKIYRNQGAMTPGSTDETVDGMSQRKIDAIIEAVRYERYRWTPVRRTYIEKKNSTKRRPLGIPTWSDKLLQEVIRFILEAYYEPRFSTHSHGFRPGRGCHTALSKIFPRWKGTVWFIEGDVTGCFDNLDHAVLLSILREHIHDERFLRLISELLKVGYLEDWKRHATYSGSPQGGIVSPILSNIYLDRLDRYVETSILQDHNRGKRKHSLEYINLVKAASALGKSGYVEQSKELRKEFQRMSSMRTEDPEYRRLRYVRYADDFLLGFTGPKHEAEAIKAELGTFLRDSLKLELSETKTLITHGRTDTARFLGYDLRVAHADTHRHTRRRTANGVIDLRVPSEVVHQWCQRYMLSGKPMHRSELILDSEYDIITKFQSEYRGIAEYYKLARNRSSLSRLNWVMQQALLRTLAAKSRRSIRRTARRYGATIATERGPRKVLQVIIERPGKSPLIARWGGISLARAATAPIKDEMTPAWRWGRTELVQRLLANTCELCGSQESVEVHHLRHLRDLKRPGRAERPEWVQRMAARQRKTLSSFVPAAITPSTPDERHNEELLESRMR